MGRRWVSETTARDRSGGWFDNGEKWVSDGLRFMFNGRSLFPAKTWKHYKITGSFGVSLDKSGISGNYATQKSCAISVKLVEKFYSAARNFAPSRELSNYRNISPANLLPFLASFLHLASRKFIKIPRYSSIGNISERKTITVFIAVEETFTSHPRRFTGDEALNFKINNKRKSFAPFSTAFFCLPSWLHTEIDFFIFTF